MMQYKILPPVKYVRLVREGSEGGGPSGNTPLAGVPFSSQSAEKTCQRHVRDMLERHVRDMLETCQRHKTIKTYRNVEGTYCMHEAVEEEEEEEGDEGCRAGRR